MSQVPESSVPSSRDGEAEISVSEAAALLRAATQRARRQFDVWPPYLLVLGAAIFLGAYGAVWWSVHDQSPYVGPSGAALVAMYGGIALWAAVSAAVVRRATQGVSGPSLRSRNFRTSYLVILVAYASFQGALYHAGASHAIVYGIFPASVPWLFAGTVAISVGVVHEEARTLLLGGALIAIGLAGAYSGPRVAWLVSGIGLAVSLLGFAVYRAVKQRA